MTEIAVAVVANTDAVSLKQNGADGCTPSGPELKRWMQEARAANSDDRQFINALDTHVQGGLRVLYAVPFDASDSPSLDVMLYPRYIAYKALLLEAVRKRDPVDAVEVPRGFVLQVAPQQVDAPDIIKIIVERDGQTIEPLSGKLEVHAFKTATGAERSLHSGELTYPCGAFAPGGTVTITAIPESGNNLAKKLSDDLSYMR